MAVAIIFALMFIVMLMKVFLPKGMKVTGKRKFEVKLAFVERLMLQRVNLYSIGAVLALMTITGTITNGFQLIIIALTQAILLIPVRVIVTSEGVALNNVAFRTWSEFVGFTVAPRRISLIGETGTRAMNIPLLASRQKDFMKALERHLPEIKARKEARAENRVTVG